MNVSFQRRSQGLFLRAPSGITWRSLGASRLAALLGRELPYNIRLLRTGDELEVGASIAPLRDIECRRRAWLEAEVANTARGLRGAGAAELPGAPGAPALEPIRRVAEAHDWKLTETDDGGLEITFPGEEHLPPLAARTRPDGGGVRLERDPGLLPAGRGSRARERALVHAALGLNARLAQARLRLLDPGRARCRVECHLPAEDLDEDEAEFALEGVRYAALEATRLLTCLRDERVARNYAAAQNVSLHEHGGK